MPHLLLDRIRSAPDWSSSSGVFPTWKTPLVTDKEGVIDKEGRRRTAFVAYAVEISDISAGVIFTIGSICFLPAYSRDLHVFLWGCKLFVIGSVIYVLLCSFTFTEACIHEGWRSLEAFEHGLYVLGSWIFLVGTILYWPEEANHEQIEWMKGLAPGVYFNLMSPEFEGTLLFIVGSLIFVAAAFVNGLNQRSFDTTSSKMLTAITSMYMVGSLLYTMGSVAFLPELGCNENMVTIGAWAFILGSLFFVAGGSLSFIRTNRELSGAWDKEDAESKFRDSSSQSAAKSAPELEVSWSAAPQEPSTPSKSDKLGDSA